jgi:hypothetical protein
MCICVLERFLFDTKKTLKEENITPETPLKLKILWWKTPFKWVDPVALHLYYSEVSLSMSPLPSLIHSNSIRCFQIEF